MSSSFRTTLIASATTALFLGPLMAPGMGAVWAQNTGHFGSSPSGRPMWVAPSPPVLGGSFIALASTYGAQLRVTLAPASVYQEIGLNYNPALTTARELMQTLPDGSVQLVVRLTAATPGPVYALAQVATPTGQRFVQFQLTDNAPGQEARAQAALRTARTAKMADRIDEAGNVPRADRSGASRTKDSVTRDSTARARSVGDGAEKGASDASSAATTGRPTPDNSPSLGSIVVRPGDTLNAIATTLARPGKAAALSQALYARNLGAFNGSVDALNAHATLQIPQRTADWLSPEGLNAVQTGPLSDASTSALASAGTSPKTPASTPEVAKGSTASNAAMLGDGGSDRSTAAARTQLHNALQRGLLQGKADAVADASAGVEHVGATKAQPPLNLDAIPNTVGGSLQLRVLLAEKTAELAQVRSAQARMAQREHDLEQQISTIQGRLDSISALLDHDRATLARAQQMADRYGSAGRAVVGSSAPSGSDRVALGAERAGMNPSGARASAPAGVSFGATTSASSVSAASTPKASLPASDALAAERAPVGASGTIFASNASARPPRPLPSDPVISNGLSSGASPSVPGVASATSAASASSASAVSVSHAIPSVATSTGSASSPADAALERLNEQTRLTTERSQATAPRPGLASAVRANTGAAQKSSSSMLSSTSTSWPMVIGGTVLIFIFGGIALWQRRRKSDQ